MCTSFTGMNWPFVGTSLSAPHAHPGPTRSAVNGAVPVHISSTREPHRFVSGFNKINEFNSSFV